MKRIKLLAFAFVIGTSSLFATEIIPDIPVKEVRHQVVKLFSTHDFMIENDINIVVIFEFNIEGKIVVLHVNSKNRAVLNYVERYMNNKRIVNPGEVGRVFRVPIKFTGE